MRLCDINWGDDSAERDPNLLNYFFDSEAFSRLSKKEKSIVVGRKGSGKSALRKRLEETFDEEKDTHVVSLSPRFNSIRTILNDRDIQKSFGQEIFFQHTWIRQILLDCLCVAGNSAKGKYCKDSMDFARNISVELNRTSKDMVENIAEIISKIKVKAANLGELGLSLEKELRSVAEVDALEFHVKKIASDGAKFVVLIDDLDLGWNNSIVANQFLLGLLAAINHLGNIHPNIHLIIFMREDVYALIITKTQHSDKYRNIEKIRWSKTDLINILERRIGYNREKHGLPNINDVFHSVFPVAIGTANADNWMIERTLSRPRELIQLSRYYTEAIDSDWPDDSALKSSEQDYSSWKLEDLCTEYSNQYPNLIDVFTYWKSKFFRTKYHLKKNEFEEILFQIANDVEINQEWFNEIVKTANLDIFIGILYEIGFIGDFVLGGDGGSKTFYSYADRHSPRFEEIQIHPCFRRAISTVERIRR